MVPRAGAVQIPNCYRASNAPRGQRRGEKPLLLGTIWRTRRIPPSRLARGACRALTRLEPWSCGPDSKTQIVGQFAILKQRHPPAALEEEVRPPATWHYDLVGYDSLRVSRTIYSCYLGRHFFLEASVGTLAGKPRRSLLSRFPRPSSSRGPTPRAGTRHTCPVEGFMMQPPLPAAMVQWQPLSSVSWFIPKLWPSSCARVTAAPRGLSEWSSKKTQGHRCRGHVSLALLPSPLPSPILTSPQHLTESVPLEGRETEPIISFKLEKRFDGF